MAGAVPPSRAARPSTRSAGQQYRFGRFGEQCRILDRLHELADRPLDLPRRPAERVLGCCRDVTLLLLTAARHRGVPARARVGFAAYFIPGWYLDHVVAEVWDAAASRWRLVEPQLAQGFPDAGTGLELDLLDVPRDRFLTGPAAWRACREGRADPERFVVDPRSARTARWRWRPPRYRSGPVRSPPTGRRPGRAVDPADS